VKHVNFRIEIKPSFFLRDPFNFEAHSTNGQNSRVKRFQHIENGKVQVIQLTW